MDYWQRPMRGTGRKFYLKFCQQTQHHDIYTIPTWIMMTKVRQHLHLSSWVNGLYIHLVGHLWRWVEISGKRRFLTLDADNLNTKKWNLKTTSCQAVDIQNATLAGGVIVGASADMMLQVIIYKITFHVPIIFNFFHPYYYTTQSS